MSKQAKRSEAEISNHLIKHWHEAVPNDRMAHLVKDTSRSFLRSLQARLARHDVSLGHWTYLRILWERDGLTQRELSQEAGVMEPSTLTAIRAMEALGYVVRQQLDGNRKNNYIFLTSAGKALKRKLVPLAEEVNALAVAGLSAQDVAVARRSLLVMLDNLTSDAELTDGATDVP